jgi:hypothetical protein
MSVTHSWFGPVAGRPRRTRSGPAGLGALASVDAGACQGPPWWCGPTGCVGPSMPSVRISQVSWSRPTLWSARRAAFQIFRAP